MTTIVLSLLGLGLAVIATISLLPRLSGKTVVTTVTSTPPVVAEVAPTTQRDAPEKSTQTVYVQPSTREKVWVYGMLVIGGFVGLFSIGTAVAWFYFLVKKDGDVPPAVTEMLKYLVTSFTGIFVGFMGGSSLPAGNGPSTGS